MYILKELIFLDYSFCLPWLEDAPTATLDVAGEEGETMVEEIEADGLEMILLMPHIGNLWIIQSLW